jgi:hypothetical protein
MKRGICNLEANDTQMIEAALDDFSLVIELQNEKFFPSAFLYRSKVWIAKKRYDLAVEVRIVWRYSCWRFY